MLESTLITKEVAAHVLYFFRGEGYPPGGFADKLMQAFAAADRNNRHLLGLGYPDYYRAISMAMDDMDGIDKLRGILNG